LAISSVEAEKSRALAADLRVLIGTRVVATVGIFNLYDLGTEISERLGTGGTGDDAGEIDN
jgi:hypothetical protein